MNTVTYVVRPGDTPRRIAQRFGVSYPSLLAVNPQWEQPPLLIDGELVFVPVAAPRRVYQAGEWIELPAAGAGRIVSAEVEYGPHQLSHDLALLKETYPFLSVETIGTSVLGQPLWALRIGEGAVRWHFNGTCHANEWITTILLLRFAEDYARACRDGKTVGGKQATELFGRTTLWMVPMLNPDGAELAQEGLRPGHPLYGDLLAWNRGSHRFTNWKANARGVDLNDQFPAHWEDEQARRLIAGPGPRDYGGPAPLSEPEARALAEWTMRMDFHAVLALHTQGEEVYWNYRGSEPPEAQRWASRLAAAAGYRAVRLTGSDAGYKDWFIQTFRRPGFTVEAGWGHNPLSLEAFPDTYEGVAKLLAEALDLAKD